MSSRLQSGHDLFQAGDDDMSVRQGIGQIRVAFVGDQDDGPGFGDQHVGAGQPDIGA